MTDSEKYWENKSELEQLQRENTKVHDRLGISYW